MNLLLITLAVALLPVLTCAQVPFGPRFGGGLASIDASISAPAAGSRGPGHVGFGGFAGFFVGGPVKGNAGLRGEFTVKVRHHAYDFTSKGNTGRTSVLMNTVQIPAMVMIRWRSGLQFMTGPALEIPISGMISDKVIRPGSTRTGELTTSFKDKMKMPAISWLFQAGYGWSNGTALAIRLDNGLTSILRRTEKIARINDVMLVLEFDLKAGERSTDK